MTETNSTAIQKRHIGQWTALGIPKGQPRPRAFVRGGRAAVYDSGTAEGWKSAVATACKELAGRGLHQCLALSLTFYMPRPKSHYTSKGALKPASPRFLHCSKPDADNLAKAVMDALTGIQVWLDDDQVSELIVRRQYEQAGSFPPGCVIRIAELIEVEI
jgi:Holliday junction resolvase RusA-like endonuclease